jgi:N-acetylmuramoyl-L-alanine amidase
MKTIPSPNFNDRATDIALEYIVLHYTGMKDATSAIAQLCYPKSDVSAHYVVLESGEIVQLVDEKKRAWHAGKSFWRGITDIKSASIGIEIVNPGHEFGYRAFPGAQIAAVKKLIKEIIARHNMKAKTCLLAHSDIAPTRKQDPGELFPWPELAAEGLGVFPNPKPEDRKPANDAEITALLGRIGYDTSAPREVVQAFQRRYHTENLIGAADAETTARIRALARQMAS